MVSSVSLDYSFLFWLVVASWLWEEFGGYGALDDLQTCRMCAAVAHWSCMVTLPE